MRLFVLKYARKPSGPYEPREFSCKEEADAIEVAASRDRNPDFPDEYHPVRRERIASARILAALAIPLAAAEATADDNYEKICRANENLQLLDDNADANLCRQIAIGSQTQDHILRLLRNSAAISLAVTRTSSSVH